MVTKSSQARPMVYRYRRGNSFGVPAQVVGDELSRIESRDGGITPEKVVEAARPKQAPLHPAFEWDDGVAGELYRRQQAGQLIRSVYVVPEEEDEAPPSPAWVSVIDSASSERQYVATPLALSDEEKRATVLADALAQLEGLRRRYSALQELAKVWTALDEIARPAA